MVFDGMPAAGRSWTSNPVSQSGSLLPRDPHCLSSGLRITEFTDQPFNLQQARV